MKIAIFAVSYLVSPTWGIIARWQSRFYRAAKMKKIFSKNKSNVAPPFAKPAKQEKEQKNFQSEQKKAEKTVTFVIFLSAKILLYPRILFIIEAAG